MNTIISVVIGTHKETPVPKDVNVLGLLERFAIVQNTSRPDKTYMYFDSDLAIKILSGLEQVLGVPARVITDTKKRDTLSIQALAASYTNQADEEERDPFERAEFWQADKLVCLVITEGWSAVGGPAIYHDSITYSVYSANDISEKLLAELQNIGIVPSAIHRTRKLGDTTGLVSANE